MPIPVELSLAVGGINKDLVPYNSYSPELIKYLDKMLKKNAAPEITLEYLMESEAPLEFVALIRGKARSVLLEGMRDKFFWRLQAESDDLIVRNILNNIQSYCSGECMVGDINERDADSGE